MRAVIRHRLAFALLAVASFGGSFALGRWVLASAAPASAQDRPSITASAPGEAMPASAAATAGEVRTAFAAALEGDDPTVRAHRLLAWLETVDAATFRQLGAEPEKFPWARLKDFDEGFQIACFHSIAERWLALDPEGAWAGMDRVQDSLNMWRTREGLLSAAGRIQPEAALAKMPFQSKRGDHLANHTYAALSTLALRDLQAARLFAGKLEDSRLRVEAWTAIGEGLAERDPMAALALAEETGYIYPIALHAAEKIGPEMVRQVLRAAGQRLDPRFLTPDFVLRYPELAADLPDGAGTKSVRISQTDAALASADRLSPERRRALLDGCDALSATAAGTLAAALVSSWARTEPLAAADWAMAHGQADDVASPRNAAAQQAFLRWVNNDADAALAWWRKLPASPLRDALGTNASTFLLEDDRLEAALEIFRTHAGNEERDAVVQFATHLVEHDPNSAGKWLASLPVEAVTDDAAWVVVQEWYLRSPESAARWIESLPASAARDYVVQNFVQTAVPDDPQAAAEWVELIADPKLRKQAAREVFWRLRNQTPEAARKWLGELRGVDPVWQARILRMNP